MIDVVASTMLKVALTQALPMTDGQNSWSGWPRTVTVARNPMMAATDPTTAARRWNG